MYSEVWVQCLLCGIWTLKWIAWWKLTEAETRGYLSDPPKGYLSERLLFDNHFWKLGNSIKTNEKSVAIRWQKWGRCIKCTCDNTVWGHSRRQEQRVRQGNRARAEAGWLVIYTPEVLIPHTVHCSAHAKTQTLKQFSCCFHLWATEIRYY